MVSPGLQSRFQQQRSLAEEIPESAKRGLLEVLDRDRYHKSASLSQRDLCCQVLRAMVVGRVIGGCEPFGFLGEKHGGETPAVTDDHLVVRVIHCRALVD